ncbi:alcohol dehydrogenase catalytic domain-containing protein [Daejeonella sp. H1SJ63]|uniref:alcohol dehydrogenase catalytic domain-containing protein n=1 Tax=Daejeonella sp. H1SJ63 TaxID=3034145 RepID=UPI0023EAA046|nr:alcohol dehydrogenase catalytic domain-containing protein [Daejeonella sp. H1SJ63]
MNKSTYARFEGSGNKLELMQDELPELKEGEILVKNTFTTLCRSDLYTYQGIRKEKTPTILGHEITGYIVAFGPDCPKFDNRGEKLKPGDRITWAIYASDPEDPNSRKGFPQKAKNIFKYGHEQITGESNFHGGLSQFTIIRKHTPIVILKKIVSDQVAALINCSVATMAATVRLAGDLRDKHVLICGAGMLGIIGSAMASTSSAKTVSSLDIDNNRLKISKLFGSKYTGNNVNEFKRKFDIIIETSGVPEVMTDTLQQLEIGGVAVWVGAVFPQNDLKINAEFIVRNLITIKGLHNYNDFDLISAVDFIEKNIDVFDFRKLITADFDLQNVNQAFDFAVNQKPYRVGVFIP